MTLHTVSLDITTACDQACPECCCGIHMHRPAIHHDWPYFERAAEVLRGIDRIVITGGEPTLHPQFVEFSRLFRKLFQCRVMTLNSNGWGFQKYAAVIANNYNWVDYSDYGIKGRETGEWLVRVAYGQVHRIDMTAPDSFVPRIRRAGGKPCSRACFRSGGFAYADGKLWGCCVAPGISGAVGMEAAEGWREALLSAPLPCKDCWFSE